MAQAALGAGGPKSSPSPTLEFHDLAGDAIRSDGSGPYEVSVQNEGSSFVIGLTKTSEIWLDFTNCDPVENLSCDGPFAPEASSGFVGGATIEFADRVSESGVSYYASVLISFQTPGGGKWRLDHGFEVTPYDDDANGSIDRLVLPDDGTTASQLLQWEGPRRGPGGSNDYPRGHFFMPWGADLRLR